MPRPSQTRPARTPALKLAILSITLTLAVFGTVLVVTHAWLRDQLHRQTLAREATVLNARAWLAENPPTPSGQPLQAHPLDHLAQILRTARLRGVLGVRLLDVQGDVLTADPPTLPDTRPPTNLLTRITTGGLPVTQLVRTPDDPDGRDYSELLSGMPLPALIATLPILGEPTAPPVGFAEFTLDATALVQELNESDQRLLTSTLLQFLNGALLISLTLAWTFRRLHLAHQVVEERTRQLLQANHDLSLSARMSAIGAITSHLVHGLKNPLFGLQRLAAAHPDPGNHSAEAWAEAATGTRRMQDLVNEVVRILREEGSPSQYQLDTNEILQLLENRIQPQARQAQVQLRLHPAKQPVSIPNREANLILLILENLARNAIQASPAGRIVELGGIVTPNQTTFSVSDQGCGIPPSSLPHLFQPVQSSKPGGSGIGLAISHQLATHLGASLELVESSTSGTRFVLKCLNASKTNLNRSQDPAISASEPF